MILREHRMTAGVGRTVPEGCRNAAVTDDACRRVMEGKREHGARLVTAGSRCFSGCVYALMGAAVRHVARDAQLGIHSVRVVAIPGRKPVGRPPGVADIHHVLKATWQRWVSIPPSSMPPPRSAPTEIRFMSRDEFARFGVETRGFYEFGLDAARGYLEAIHRAQGDHAGKGADGKEYRTGSLRMRCLGAADRIWLGYRREVASNEVGAATVVRIAAGESELMLHGVDGKGADDLRSGMASTEFLRNAVAAPSIVLTETFTPAGSAAGWSRVIKLTTNGLSKALEELRTDCVKSVRPDAAGVSSGR